MTPLVGFVVFLLATVVLLLGVVVTGLRAKLAVHLSLVGLTLVSLAVTIVYAKALGLEYDLASAGRITPVHLTLAKIATAAYLAPALTGVLTMRDRKHKRLHFKAAMFALVLTVASTVTGLWMLLAASPRA
ncbi:MAG: hypothetical protein L6Q99_03980 [Planctomycetes bacterium]|nr:hypothetical protein [Planctomycetota bacterium]